MSSRSDSTPPSSNNSDSEYDAPKSSKSSPPKATPRAVPKAPPRATGKAATKSGETSSRVTIPKENYITIPADILKNTYTVEEAGNPSKSSKSTTHYWARNINVKYPGVDKPTHDIVLANVLLGPRKTGGLFAKETTLLIGVEKDIIDKLIDATVTPAFEFDTASLVEKDKYYWFRSWYYGDLSKVTLSVDPSTGNTRFMDTESVLTKAAVKGFNSISGGATVKFSYKGAHDKDDSTLVPKWSLNMSITSFIGAGMSNVEGMKVSTWAYTAPTLVVDEFKPSSDLLDFL